MWGLILKDLYTSKNKILISLLTVIFGYGFISVAALVIKNQMDDDEKLIFCLLFVGLEIMVLFAAFMVLGNIINSCFAEDEKVNWQNFLVSTPIMIKKQVIVKYIEATFFYVLALGYGLLLSFSIKQICGIKISNKIVLGVFVFFLIQSLIELPFIFKVGSKYGNYIKTGFCLFIAFAFIVYGLYGTLPPNINQDKIVDFCARLSMGDPDAVKYFKSIINFCKYALPVITVLLYGASVFASFKCFTPEKTFDKE